MLIALAQNIIARGNTFEFISKYFFTIIFKIIFSKVNLKLHKKCFSFTTFEFYNLN